MNRMFRRMLSLLVVVIICFGLFVSKSPSAKAINNFKMKLSNTNLGETSEYKFNLSLEKRLEVHEWIKLVFPAGSTFKITPYIPPPVDYPCKTYQSMFFKYLPDGSFELLFNTHIVLDPSIEGYQNIVITVSGEGDFKSGWDDKTWHYQLFNPTVTNFYQYKIATKAEPELVNSEPILIGDFPSSTPTISSPIVDIEPSITKKPAGYSIDFDLSSLKGLITNQDTIQIQFPKEVTFNIQSQTINRNWIMVNDSFLLHSPSTLNNILTIPIPIDIKPGQHVSIKIDSRVGIANPVKAGAYSLKVMISSEPYGVRSFPYFVATSTYPVLLKVAPWLSDGLSEFNIVNITQRKELNPLDTIYIRFPNTVALPPFINSDDVLINNKPCFNAIVDGQVVAIKLRSHAKSWMPLEIKFNLHAGIKTPTSKEGIRLELKIQPEGEFIPTNLVEIF